MDDVYIADLAADLSLAAACSVSVALSSASSASPWAFLKTHELEQYSFLTELPYLLLS